MEYAIYDHFYSLKEVLSCSWKWFIKKFWLILAIAAIICLPIDIILNYIFFDNLNNPEVVTSKITFASVNVQILGFLFGMVATMAIAYIIKNGVDGKNITISQALKKAFIRWPAAFITGILTGIFLFGLTILFVVPGLIYIIYWVFIVYAVILKDKSLKEAMNCSKAAVKGRWGKVFLYLFIFLILQQVISFVMGAFVEILPEGLYANIITSFLKDVIGTFFIVVYAVFFINLDSNQKEDFSNVAIAS